MRSNASRNAITSGPAMMPSSPNMVMPPSRARNTSPVCISTLPRIANGLTTLSAAVKSTPHHAPMKMAAVTCPVSTSNAVTGIQMSAVPITGTNEATSVAIPRKRQRRKDAIYGVLRLGRHARQRDVPYRLDPQRVPHPGQARRDFLRGEGKNARNGSDDRPENEECDQRAGEAAASFEQPLGPGKKRLEGRRQDGSKEQGRPERPDDVDREGDGQGEQRPESAPAPRGRSPRAQRGTGGREAFERRRDGSLGHE